MSAKSDRATKAQCRASRLSSLTSTKKQPSRLSRLAWLTLSRGLLNRLRVRRFRSHWVIRVGATWWIAKASLRDRTAQQLRNATHKGIKFCFRTEMCITHYKGNWRVWARSQGQEGIITTTALIFTRTSTTIVTITSKKTGMRTLFWTRVLNWWRHLSSSTNTTSVDKSGRVFGKPMSDTSKSGRSTSKTGRYLLTQQEISLKKCRGLLTTGCYSTTWRCIFRFRSHHRMS